MIHELASVHPDAKIGEGVEIGPFCTIEEGVEIGEGTRLRAYVELRNGTVIGKRCYVDSRVSTSGDVVVGDDVTLRYDTILARGCRVGDHSYVCPRVMTNNLDTGGKQIGGARIGARCFIGTNAVLHHGITIEEGAVIGALAFVNKDVPAGEVWIGSPATRHMNVVRKHASVQIHPTASLGLPPGVFSRGEGGSRPPKIMGCHGVELSEDVVIQAETSVVYGTERPTRLRRGARMLNRSHVGHDCDIGEHVIIGGGAFLCGWVEIGARTELKARCEIRNRVKIGTDCIIGMGATIVKNVPDNTVAFVRNSELVLRQNRPDRPWVHP